MFRRYQPVTTRPRRQPTQRRDRWLTWTIILLLVLPSLPLLLPLPFYIDWVNHIWRIEHFRQAFLSASTFPAVVTTTTAAGDPAPLFYGLLFYPLLSVIATVVGSDLAVRLVASALLVAAPASYYIFSRAVLSPLSALLCSLLLTSSVYQMTNLYSRSALTEFTAAQLALISIPLIGMGITGPARIRSPATCLGFAFLAGAVGTHPITALLLLLCVGPIISVGALLVARSLDRRSILRLVLGVAAVAIICLPWMMLVILHGAKLAINSSPALEYFPNSIDSLAARLLPWSFDVRVLASPIAEVSTPFLTAPLNLFALPATLLALWNYYARDSRALLLAVVGTTAMISAAALMMPPLASRGLDHALVLDNQLWIGALTQIQYAYRLTNGFSFQLATLFAIAILGATLSGAEQGNRTKEPSWARCTLVSATIVAAFAIVAKTTEVCVEFTRYPTISARTYERLVRDAANLPPMFYGSKDYSMPQTFPPSTPAGDGREHHSAIFTPRWTNDAVLIQCTEACMVGTNVLASPLVGFEDGDSVVKRHRIYEHLGRVVLSLTPGQHALKLRTNGIIVDLIRLARSLWLLWFFGALLWFLAACLRQPRRTQRVTA